MRVALDIMGGDLAPEAPIEGAMRALETFPDLEVLLVGDPDLVSQSLRHESRVKVISASEVIGTAESPVQAVRTKNQSSLVQMIRLLKTGDAEAAISAGNTGALMAAGLFSLGRMPGIERPALTAILPTFSTWGVLLLDVGANLEPRPSQLYQYAVMGTVYCREVYGIERPRVALLNVGAEPEKGPPWIREAHQLMANESGIHFVGNLESRELLQGKADVVVTDGFAGNVALKAIEGISRDIFREVRGVLRHGIRNQLGGLLLKSGLTGLKKRWDYQEQGGAPLLGLNHIVYKCHGSSDARAFEKTIAVARHYDSSASQERIREFISQGGSS